VRAGAEAPIFSLEIVSRLKVTHKPKSVRQFTYDCADMGRSMLRPYMFMGWDRRHGLVCGRLTSEILRFAQDDRCGLESLWGRRLG
jgi:hypothetical protein